MPNDAKVIQFSTNWPEPLMLKCRLKTPGRAMSSKRSPPSIEPLDGQRMERLLSRLQKLDAEQLQIIEIVAAAILRGAR